MISFFPGFLVYMLEFVMWKDQTKFLDAIRKEHWAKDIPVHDDFWNHLIEWVQEHILPAFLSHITHQVDEISDINPDLSDIEILAMITQYMVDFLGALSASVRIYDPETEQMLSYGSYPSEESSREPYIPLEKSVAGEVVKKRMTYLVPNILKEKLYQDKKVIERKGAFSLMAIPLEIPSFSLHERNTVGVIQIYYPEQDRTFTPLEIQMG